MAQVGAAVSSQLHQSGLFRHLIKQAAHVALGPLCQVVLQGMADCEQSQ